MAYALNNTKRKFHRILDSLTNISSTSLVETPNKSNSPTAPGPNTNTSTKRARLDRPISASAALSTETTLKSTRTPSGSSNTTLERKNPSFAPWDRSQFLNRLETFRQVHQWAPKPDAVNEVQWAKRGWRCVGVERVGCHACGRVVVLKLESKERKGKKEDVEIADEEWSANVEDQLVRRYSKMIISEHDQNCLWRRRGCDDSIYRLPLVQASTSIPALRKRYDSLLKISRELPSNASLPENINLSLILRSLPEDFFNDPGNEITQGGLATNNGKHSSKLRINEVAFALALFGWDPEPGEVEGLVSCKACFRRLGLWLFRPRSKKHGDAWPNEEDTDPVMSRLDVTQHRDYCPWINAISQNGGPSPGKVLSTTESLCGWKILIQVLENAYHIQGVAKDQQPEIVLTDRIRDMDDNSSEAASLTPTAAEDRDVKDKERFAKLRKLRKIFDVKGSNRLAKRKSAMSSAPASSSLNSGGAHQ
ncbi:MAG: hypothetical protein M1834_002585 [Cirrosporium novae-zelandiae]|nr:MAG: hypothetical protein M1834_002585 [Cirrosporium novae-zelandiae]